MEEEQEIQREKRRKWLPHFFIHTFITLSLLIIKNPWGCISFLVSSFQFQEAIETLHLVVNEEVEIEMEGARDEREFNKLGFVRLMDSIRLEDSRQIMLVRPYTTLKQEKFFFSSQD